MYQPKVERISTIQRDDIGTHTVTFRVSMDGSTHDVIAKSWNGSTDIFYTVEYVGNARIGHGTKNHPVAVCIKRVKDTDAWAIDGTVVTLNRRAILTGWWHEYHNVHRSDHNGSGSGIALDQHS